MTDAPSLRDECLEALETLPSPIDCAALEGFADAVTREIARTYANDAGERTPIAAQIEEMLEQAAVNDGFSVVRSDFSGLPKDLLSVLLFAQRYIVQRRTLRTSVSLIALAYTYAATQRGATDTAQIWYLALALLIPRSLIEQLGRGVTPTINNVGELTGWALPLWVLEIRVTLLRRMAERAA
jgi:hypothetical protein